MSYTETLEQSHPFRLVLVADECADVPYDDGGSPVLYVREGYGQRTGQVREITSYVIPSGITDALHRWSDDLGLFERYVRAFHGVTVVSSWVSDGATYVTCDPADWREMVGAPAGSVSLDEWRAYVEGDVYAYRIEREVQWTSTAPRGTMTTWEPAESLWGLYGYDNAVVQAREDFAEYVSQASHVGA